MFILAEQVTFTLAEVSDVHGGVKSNNGLPSTTGVISERGLWPRVHLAASCKVAFQPQQATKRNSTTTLDIHIPDVGSRPTFGSQSVQG